MLAQKVNVQSETDLISTELRYWPTFQLFFLIYFPSKVWFPSSFTSSNGRIEVWIQLNIFSDPRGALPENIGWSYVAPSYDPDNPIILTPSEDKTFQHLLSMSMSSLRLRPAFACYKFINGSRSHTVIKTQGLKIVERYLPTGSEWTLAWFPASAGKKK